MKFVKFGVVLAATVVGSGAAMAGNVSLTPASGVEQLSGYIEGYGGLGSQANWANPYGGWPGFGGAARAAYRVSPTWSIQADIFGSHNDVPDDAYYKYGQLGGAIHLSRRGANGLFGLVGGYTQVESYEGYYGFGGLFYGLEAQADLGHFSLYGQAGGLTSISGYYQSSYPVNEIFGRIVGRYFVKPNLKLEAGLTLFNGDIWGPSDPDTTLIWNAKAEYKFNGPISTFVAVDGTHSSYVRNDSYDPVYRAMVGVKLSFGGGTLEDANRDGASLDTPDFSAIGFARNH